jgi:pimeloyl-ACP methyl ester carboxylesterase
MGDNVHAPRGVLLVLSGGPGQPGLPILDGYVSKALAAERNQYRIVVFDQRGTGAGALDCKALQHEMGSSDLTPPKASAVRACARKVGTRRQFFGTDDTVADMEVLRGALGVDKWAIDGISYGTYVGERYGLAHPSHVSKLVLDSVVPQVGETDLGVNGFAAVRRVFRSICGSGCLADMATVVRRDHLGPQLFDALTFDSIADPTYRKYWNVPAALHAAARGNRKQLDAFLAAALRFQRYPADLLDQGLHASTLCADWRFPWGSSAAPLVGRADPGEEALSVRSPNGLGKRVRSAVSAVGADEADSASARQAACADADGGGQPRPVDPAHLGAPAARPGAQREARRRPGRRSLGAVACRERRRPTGRSALPARLVDSPGRVRGQPVPVVHLSVCPSPPRSSSSH